MAPIEPPTGETPWIGSLCIKMTTGVWGCSLSWGIRLVGLSLSLSWLATRQTNHQCGIPLRFQSLWSSVCVHFPRLHSGYFLINFYPFSGQPRAHFLCVCWLIYRQCWKDHDTGGEVCATWYRMCAFNKLCVRLTDFPAKQRYSGLYMAFYRIFSNFVVILCVFLGTPIWRLF